MNKTIKTSIKNIGDPFILPYKGIYYHYSTSDSKGFIVYQSKDLIEWERLGYCYTDSKVGYMDFWAPEVFEHYGNFYMFFTAKNKERDTLLLNVAVADSPVGPFTDVFDKPTFDFGYAAIDATIFKDDDGSIYMYYVRDCSQNIVNGVHTSQIYGVKLKDNLIEVDGEPVMLLSPQGSNEQRDPLWQWNESPAMLKHNGKYYLSYSSNFFADKNYSVSYAVADHPLGIYHKANHNPILKFIEGETSGPGHNMYFKTFDGKKLTAYHIHTDIAHPSGNRRTCFSPYEFKNEVLIIDYNMKE